LGGNYTHDTKDFSASISSTDTFSKIDFDSPFYAPFREQLLYQGGLAQQVGNALMLGRSATQAEIIAFASDPVTGPIFANQIQPAVAAFADANQNNPAANPLIPLRAVQYLPPFLAVPNAVEDGKVSDNDFSYTIRLAYDLGPSINIYASYATGFKAASVNLSRDSRPRLADMAALASAGLLQVNQTYGSRIADPEESTVYELGVKGSWRSASANIAVFEQEIKGFQSNIFTGTGFELGNAGKQSTFGVEFEGQAELVPGFTARLGVTYLDPTYDDFVFSAVGDLSGTTPAGIPNWTVVLGGQYAHELGSGDRLILNATYHYESEEPIVDGLPGFLSLGTDTAVAVAKQFTREVSEVDASITYAMENGLELSAWGRNLTDDRYLQTLFDSVAQPFSVSGYTNQPRTFGGTIRYKW
jgi:outer membrane receptor protein involved in Fe transport